MPGPKARRQSVQTSLCSSASKDIASEQAGHGYDVGASIAWTLTDCVLTVRQTGARPPVSRPLTDRPLERRRLARPEKVGVVEALVLWVGSTLQSKISTQTRELALAGKFIGYSNGLSVVVAD